MPAPAPEAEPAEFSRELDHPEKRLQKLTPIRVLELNVSLTMGGSGRWHRLDEGRWARARSLQMDSIFDDSQDAPYAIMAFALHCLDRSDLEQLLQMGLHHRWSWRIREIYEKAVDAYFTEHFGEDFSETFGISSLSLQDLFEVVAIMRCWKAGSEDAEALEAELCRLCQVDLASQDGRTFQILGRSSCCGR